MSIFDRILRRRSHYRVVFRPSRSADAVLADLKRFSNWGAAPLALGKDGHTDLYATGMQAGRQEVFQRIVGHLSIDDAQLLKLREEAQDDH